MELPATERRRNEKPALFLGVSVAAVAGFIAWGVAFGLTPPPYIEGDLTDRLGQSMRLLYHATDEILDWTLPKVLQSPVPRETLARLSDEGLWTQVIGRILVVVFAAVGSAAPLTRWLYKRTPRRLDTAWLNTEIARWSEGSDAVLNANLSMKKSIARTGAGLEIAPGVRLSREYEARAIIAVGDPGSGKTVAFWTMIFQLRERRAHLILHDVKGDLTARWPDAKFFLLAPHDERSFAWAIGRDIVGEIRAREFAAQIIAHSERAPNWPAGAQEIFVGVILTLQCERGTDWGWADLKAALNLSDPSLRDFATRHNPAAARFLALGEDANFTLNAGSYVSTLMAPINKLVAPIAKAWSDISPAYSVSLREWLDDPRPEKPALILQRAADLPALSKAWIGAAVGLMAVHLLGTRKDYNPADGEAAPETWFLLDEFPQIGLQLEEGFFPILETGRSLGLRAMLGVQGFEQIARGNNGENVARQLRQLAGHFLAFRLQPGPDAAKITDERLTAAPVRTWVRDEETGEKIASSEDIPILTQNDLASLEITRDGAQGYLVHSNAAFGLTWPFPETPKQRPGTIRSQRFYA